MQINFIDLAQMSLDFAKNVRSLTTRVNKKKSKKKRSFNYIPPAVKEVNKEEILATEATAEQNTTDTIEPETTIEANMANVSPKHVSFYQEQSQDARVTLPPANKKAFRLPRSILVNVKGEDTKILLNPKLP
jgi:hypothetical protein